MSKWNEIYHIPSAIDSTVAEVMIDQLSKLDLEDAEVCDGPQSHRVSKVQWLYTDNWISGMMAHFINQANNHTFQYDLYGWSDKIQYTVYDSVGSKYDWHIDHTQSSLYENMWRKLSISLCLSSDYTGGELQILTNANKLQTFNMKCGDVVIFSSDLTHRVKPIKSGKRTSLVGWYCGPKFK